MAAPESILILCPTETEAEALRAVDCEIIVSGVGMAETAAAVSRLAFKRDTVDAVFLAGIGGAVPGVGFKPGDSAVAVSETIADLGAIRSGILTPLYSRTYDCIPAGKISSVPKARFGTVNCVDRLQGQTAQYDIENMEGAAFFAACLSMGIPFLEIRSVSNLTTDKREKWQIPLALESLAKAVVSVINEWR